MPRLVLLGDSILDNGSYTAPAPDTRTLVQHTLGSEWSVDLFARDGDVIAHVPTQLLRLEASSAPRPDVVVLSIGGNDALQHTDLLIDGPTSSGKLLDRLVSIGDSFGAAYESLLYAVRACTPRLVVCTIYEAPLDDHRAARHARAPLGILNDRIQQVAKRLRIEVLELRDVCTDPDDFTRQIEPSAGGAKKIAEAISLLVSH